MRVVHKKDFLEQSEKLRKQLLAKIHIAAKDAMICKLCGRVHFSKLCPSCFSNYNRNLSEFDYRAFLISVTGKSSCRTMNIVELMDVVRKFETAGFVTVKKMDFEQAVRDTRESMLKSIKAAAPRLLGECWEKRLNGFCREKVGLSAVEFCDIDQLRHVWAFMRKASNMIKTSKKEEEK
jgi:phage gp16-like protein